jgi:hypothetical protein
MNIGFEYHYTLKRKGASRMAAPNKTLKTVLRSKFLLETSVFPGSITQMIKLRPAYLGMPLNDYLLQPRRAGEKCPFDPDTVTGNPTDGKAGIITTPSPADDGTPEFLNTLGVAFFDAKMHTYHITRTQLGNIGIFSFLNRF